MSSQKTLFDCVDHAHVRELEKRRRQKPQSRPTDPATSHQAAENHERSGKAATNRAKISNAVYAAYSTDAGGPTAAEAAIVAGLGRYEASRRLPECTDVQKGPARVCRVLGSRCVTWEPK